MSGLNLAGGSRSRRSLITGLVHLSGIGALVVLLFPIAWMISTSFKQNSDVFRAPPVWIPMNPTVVPYDATVSPEIIRFFLNSTLIGVTSALIATLVGALFAYGVSRIEFPGRRALMLSFLCSLGFPIPLLMISMYIVFRQLGILNTYFAVILSHTVITLPIVVWILKDFFDTVPLEIEEAAMIDGASFPALLFRIVFPLARPGIIAAGIFVFVTSWNEFVFGLTFISDPALRPLPAGIALLFLQEFEYRWPEMMAVAVIVTIPVLVLFLLFQKQFIQGVTSGAVKG